MKKNLIILGDALDRQKAGIYRMTYELINALSIYASDQLKLSLITSKNHQFKGPVECIKPNHKTILPNNRALNYFFNYPKQAHRLKADYVLEPAHFGPFNLRENIKRITFIHDLTPVILPEFHQKASAALQRYFLPSILNKANLIICPSKQTQEDIESHYKTSSDKIFRLVPGSNHYLSIAAEKSKVLELGIDKPYFLTVGTIEPRKNLILLIQAFELYKSKSQSEDKLVFVGQKGWQYESVFDYASKSEFHNDIVFTGFIPDELLSSIYSFAKAHILTSFYEGFSLSAQDSLDLGVPTILPNHSAFKDEVKTNAVYFEINKVDSLVDKMLHLEEHSNHIAQLRSWEPTIQALLKALD